MGKYLRKVDAILERLSETCRTWLCVLSSDERARSDSDIEGVDILVVIDIYEDV